MAEVLEVWNDATIKVRQKKSDRSNCNIFREITAASHAEEVFLDIVANRLSDYYCEAHEILPEEQCGSRPCRSTVDSLFVVNRFQEPGWRLVPLYT